MTSSISCASGLCVAQEQLAPHGLIQLGNTRPILVAARRVAVVLVRLGLLMAAEETTCAIARVNAIM